jgi:hypothetical protein
LTQTAVQLRASFDYHWVSTRVVITAIQQWKDLTTEQRHRVGGLVILLNNCIEQVLATTPYSERNVGSAARPCTLASVVRQDCAELLRQVKEQTDG